MTNIFPFKYRHRKKLKLGKQNVKTGERLGNLCRAVKKKHLPWCFSPLSQRFLNQNYPKYISDVVSKILERKKSNYQMFCLNLGSSWNWVSCGESRKSLMSIFLHVSPNRFWRTFTMLLRAVIFKIRTILKSRCHTISPNWLKIGM